MPHESCIYQVAATFNVTAATGATDVGVGGYKAGDIFQVPSIICSNRLPLPIRLSEHLRQLLTLAFIPQPLR